MDTTSCFTVIATGQLESAEVKGLCIANMKCTTICMILKYGLTSFKTKSPIDNGML